MHNIYVLMGTADLLPGVKATTELPPLKELEYSLLNTQGWPWAHYNAPALPLLLRSGMTASFNAQKWFHPRSHISKRTLKFKLGQGCCQSLSHSPTQLSVVFPSMSTQEFQNPIFEALGSGFQSCSFQPNLHTKESQQTIFSM